MSCDRQISLSTLVVDSKKLANVHPSARVNSKYDFKQSTLYSAKSDLANTVAWQNYGSVKPSALLLLIKCPFAFATDYICPYVFAAKGMLNVRIIVTFAVCMVASFCHLYSLLHY